MSKIEAKMKLYRVMQEVMDLGPDGADAVDEVCIDRINTRLSTEDEPVAAAVACALAELHQILTTWPDDIEHYRRLGLYLDAGCRATMHMISAKQDALEAKQDQADQPDDA